MIRNRFLELFLVLCFFLSSCVSTNINREIQLAFLKKDQEKIMMTLSQINETFVKVSSSIYKKDRIELMILLDEEIRLYNEEAERIGKDFLNENYMPEKIYRR